jgi:arylsulfatase A-like enzyme
MNRRFPFLLVISVALYVFFGSLGLRSDVVYADSPQNDINIVLITIDTLRADHLSCYGYERTTSPNIDAIAEKGIVFRNAIAPSSWTAPSMASLFTSVYPVNHGVLHGIDYKKGETINIQEVFSDELRTLPEILQEKGYGTFGVASNLHLSEKFGFARGFDYFQCLPWVPAQRVNRTVAAWQEEIKHADKFFLWVHYFDPHHFYQARSPWIEDYTSKALTEELAFSKKTWSQLTALIPMLQQNPQALAHLIALYDSEINFVDSAIGNLFEELALDNNTLIIITADHGEEFLDHGGLGHGQSLYQEVIHIPLIVKLPYREKKEVVNSVVNLVDIMPSVLYTLKHSAPRQTVGRSFLDERGPFFWLKKFLPKKRVAANTFAELDIGFKQKTIVSAPWKYIYNFQDNTEQLYNLKRDPHELTNLSEGNNKQGERLKQSLLGWAETANTFAPQRTPFHLTPEEKKKLKALGYIQ